MAVSPSFVEHALDLVSLAAPTEARRMFGGYGLFSRGLMYGLLDDEELFLKVDDQSLARFSGAGCRRWVYPGPRGPMPGGYYRPPDEAHEDAEAMLPWAQLALEAAARKAAAKAAKGKKRATKAGKKAKAPAKAKVVARAKKAAARGKAKPLR